MKKLIWGLLPAAVFAAGLQLDFAPTQTTVRYMVTSTLHTVHGIFRLKRGELHFDPAAGTLAGELVVDATSGDSGSGSRDKRMHKEILESAKYPEIVFRPDRVIGTVAREGASKVQVHGVLEIHGAQHEITAPAEVRLSANQAVTKLHITVPYVDWGMKDASNFLLKVNRTVEIEVEATASVRQ